MVLKRFYLRFIGKDSVAMAKRFQVDSFSCGVVHGSLCWPLIGGNTISSCLGGTF